jgi:hypothetical protein
VTCLSEQGAGYLFRLKLLLLPAALAIGPVGQAGADDPGTLCAFGEVSRPSASVSQRQGAAAAIEASCAQGDTIFVDTALAALLCDLSKPSMTFNSFAICVYRGAPRALKTPEAPAER